MIFDEIPSMIFSIFDAGVASTWPRIYLKRCGMKFCVEWTYRSWKWTFREKPNFPLLFLICWVKNLLFRVQGEFVEMELVCQSFCLCPSVGNSSSTSKPCGELLEAMWIAMAKFWILIEKFFASMAWISVPRTTFDLLLSPRTTLNSPQSFVLCKGEISSYYRALTACCS